MGLVANAATVTAGTPTAASLALAVAAAGPICDWQGLANLLQVHIQECKKLVGQIKTVTDGSDPLLTTLNTIDTAL